MKIAFICSSENNYKYVYPKNIIENLKEYGFDGNCYNKEKVIENSKLFVDTEYIFSTWNMPVFTEEEIKLFFPKLKAVFYAAGSVQKFARPFLNCGVKVFSAWVANALPVAEYTVAQIILANKGFFGTSFIPNEVDYAEGLKKFRSYCGNYNAKVGIIGAGTIGKLVIQMLKSYKLEVLVFDPFLPDEQAKELGVEKTSLEQIFSKCNVVSNHLADNEKTIGMLNGKLFSKLPAYATFLNTGRGAQVVEDELIEVLKARKDIVAVLDVTLPEPPMENSELYSLENCILTPHIAGSGGNEVHRMAEYMLNEFKSFIENKPLCYEVTVEMLKTMA